MLEELLLPLEFVLGRLKIRARLEQIRPGGAEVRALDDGERVALDHSLAESAQDLDDPPAHGGKNVGHARLVEGDTPGGHQMERERTSARGLD